MSPLTILRAEFGGQVISSTDDWPEDWPAGSIGAQPTTVSNLFGPTIPDTPGKLARNVTTPYGERPP